MIRYLHHAIISQAALDGIGEEDAARLADRIINLVCTQYGGRDMHIPKRDRAAVYALMVRDYDGSNRDQVCARYEVSLATFYRILKRERERENEKTG